MPDTYHETYTPSPDPETALLQHELSEAHKTIRALMRQLNKEQQRHAETVRAQKKTIANMEEAGRERISLRNERAMWQARAEAEQVAMPFKIGGLTIDMTADEVEAIRKALARLYQPDTESNTERLKTWNAALDGLDES